MNTSEQTQMKQPLLVGGIQMNSSVQEHNQNQSNLNKQKHMSEAYLDFKERLCYDYLICEDASNFQNLIQKFNMIPGNSSAFDIDFNKFCAFCCPFTLYYPIKWCLQSNFEVPANHFALVDSQSDGLRKTEIYGPGYHMLGYYKKLIGIYSFDGRFQNNIIESPIGDLKIAAIDQGTIMHLEQGGQNIILGPGIHKITEPLQFQKIVSLDTFYIEIGPEKWVTVPDGYDGIAINRGQIRILQGGKQHHLPHVGDRFAKMVPKTLLTDRIPTDIQSYVTKQDEGKLNNQMSPQSGETSLYLLTTTAEGSTVILDTMIFWRIVDSEKSAKQAMEILKIIDNDNNQGNNRLGPNQAQMQNANYHIQMAGKNISHLRLTVLRIAKHHLTAVVGQCSLAGSAIQAQIYNNPKISKEPQDSQGYIVNSNQQHQQEQQQQFQQNAPIDQGKQNTFQILHFIQSQQATLKQIINQDLQNIGCQLDNICVYSVTPTQDIQQELDKQTKAKVDANTAIIKATSTAKAKEIEIQMNTQIAIQQARVDGDSNYIKAVKQAESNVQLSKGEVEAIKIKAQGQADAELIKAKVLAEAQIEKSKGEVESMKLLAKGESESNGLKAEGDKQATILRAQGQAEAIIQIANARKLEAQELQSSQLSQDLAKIRITGDVGEKIFSGASNKFVFGSHPGDLIYNMFNQLVPTNKK